MYGMYNKLIRTPLCTLITLPLIELCRLVFQWYNEHYRYYTVYIMFCFIQSEDLLLNAYIYI